ncbi:alpha/beta hydrolase [Bacillus sp. ISL-35]|uniref:alpha/beta fold hydrolase n=1 Tax=Bacillus sp. ISL-35 TaxID=2819122 RepID=UPI001BEB0CFD|nr:alpha/beta hydrolase [Bacillus sp. ISL-35]MBT2679095.1 alpha/beta hydrolase [Bacillus sp. ISL-35]MBT2702822.1 alpha/beta hydrolase [Chryseobacterium sp. ISL-80]
MEFARNKTVRGIDLYYEHYQNPDAKETLVLLHGFLSSTFSFRHLIPLLKEDYNVISVDLPPFGKSGKLSSFKYSYQNLATTVVELMKSLGIREFNVVGHSMGGQIAMNILLHHPDHAKKGILLCSSGYLKKASLPLVLSSYIPYFHLYVKFHLARSGVKQNLQNVVYDHSMINDEMLYGYLSPFLEDDIFKALTMMIRHREGDLSAEELRKIEAPCLLIWGEHDKVVPVRIGRKLNKDLKHSELVILKETGHLVPEERPEDVHQLINTFIEAEETVEATANGSR